MRAISPTMKAYTQLLLFLLVPFLYAEEVEELPEPSEPPFQVGDLPLESGYIIQREDAPDINFRIVNNRMHLYWIDDDGLIMEPEVSAATVRFDPSFIRETTREYHRLKRLPDDTALGSPYILVVPHRYYITVIFTPEGAEEPESYRFRYNPVMTEVKPAPTE